MARPFKSLNYHGLLRLREPIVDNIRILHFKRPKWNSLKKKFFFQHVFKKKKRRPKKPRDKGNRQKLKLYKQSGFSIPLFWRKLRSTYRVSLLSKLKFYYFFALKTRVHLLKRLFTEVPSIEEFLLKIESRLDVILWRSGFFKSPALARFYINHKNVYINHKLINLTNFILKGGDLVNLNNFLATYVIDRYSRIRLAWVKSHTKRKLQWWLRMKFPGRKIKYYSKLQKILVKWKIQEEIAASDKGPKFIFPFFLEVNWNLFTIRYIRATKKTDLSKLAYLYNTYLNLPALENYLRLL